MKLYDLPRDSYFTINPTPEGARVPPDAPELDFTTVYKLGNIDGMYSYCTAPDGAVVHVQACAEVTQVDGVN
jgi:hypothetical protein